MDVSFVYSSSSCAVRPAELVGWAYSSSLSVGLCVYLGFESSSGSSGTSSSSRILGPRVKVRLFPTMDETRK